MKRLIWLFLCTISFAQTTNYARMLSGVNYQTGTTYVVQAVDSTRVTQFNNASTVSVTLPAGTTTGFQAGTVFSVRDNGAGSVSITCSSCTINGSGTFTLTTGQSADIYSDGLNYLAYTGGGTGTGIFNVKNYGCLADDSTDNSTCFTNASAAVNAYSGPGIPVLECDMIPGDIAFKTNSSGIVFTIPARLQGNCTIDAGVGVTGTVVQLGPTGLVAFTNAQAKSYSVYGVTFVGGTGGATAITIEPRIPLTTITLTNCVNFGTSATTSWCLNALSPNPGINVINNACIINDSTTGRNCYKIVDTSGLGSNSTNFIGNTLFSATAPAFTSPCSGTGLWAGGPGSSIVGNNFFGFTNPLRISTSIIQVNDNQFDNTTSSCTSNGNFPILLGAPAQTATLGSLQIFGNSYKNPTTAGIASDATSITVTGSNIELTPQSTSQNVLDTIYTLQTGTKWRLNNITGTELLNITSGGIWTVFSGSTVNNFTLVGSTAFSVPLVNTTNVTRAAPVKADTSNANQVTFTTTTDTGAGVVVGVLSAATGSAATGNVVTTGVVALTLGTGTCSIGNFVIVDTTTNTEVKCTGSYTAGTVIGVALQADSSVGTTFNVMVGLR